ncbi:DMP19 family protein [Antarctobacter jejuensis]|uniref:DMP19 family protein n=1 Tax=Antarctobacter jejuensis TaxID=1439938 RepID=UPI003FD1B6E4
MSRIYQPNDPMLPLLLADGVFNQSITGPAQALVEHVNALFGGGYTADTLRDDFADFYCLDHYVGQVNNGGHSQFVHNSHEHLMTNLERAGRAALRLDLPELAETIGACADWCRANPEEAARQTGFDVRADALNALDEKFAGLRMSDDELRALLAQQPASLRQDLEQRLFLPDGADATIRQFAEAAYEMAGPIPPEIAVIQASTLLDPLIERRMTTLYGATPSETRDRAMVREREHLSIGLNKQFDKMTREQWVAELIHRTTRALGPDLYDRDRYYTLAWLWLRQHPDLELVPRDSLAPRRQEMIAQSPFTAAERGARVLDRLNRLIPSDNKLALARALGQVPTDGTMPFAKGTTWSDPANTLERQRHVMDTELGKLFLVKDKGTVSMHALANSYWRQAMATLWTLGSQMGVVSINRAKQRARTLLAPRAGRRVGKADVSPEVAQVMRNLHIPEALGLWSDDPAAFRMLERGLVTAIDTRVPSLDFTFPGDPGPIRIKADAQSVSIKQGEDIRPYTRAVLQRFRAERTRNIG